MLDRKLHTLTASFLVLASLLPGSQIAGASQADSPLIRADHADHAVAGELRRVNYTARTIVLHTADGGTETVAIGEDTVVYGVTSAASAVDVYAKDALAGAWVIVEYTGSGPHKTAVTIDSLGGRTVKAAHGSVVRVDPAADFIVIKTRTGAEDRFELAKSVVVDAGPAVEHGAPPCHAIEEGANVAISYSEQAGKKTAVVVNRI